MKSVIKYIKKIFNAIGQVFGLVFIWFYKSIMFIIDNTLGLIFTQTFKPIHKNYQRDFPVWTIIRKIIIALLILTLVLFFNSIYKYTLEPIFGYIIVSVGRFFGNDDIYYKILTNYGKTFASGIGTTLYLSLVGTVLGFMIAILLSAISTMKISRQDHKFIKYLKKISQGFVKIYTTIIRGTPMMVQAMILYWGVKGFINWDYMTAGLFTVTLNTSAYLTEVLRGGINALDKGQYEAGISLGLSKVKTMTHVIFPQAIKNVMPSIGNEFVINIKDTAVLSVIMVVDIFRVAEYAQAKYFQAFPAFIITAIIYLFLTTTITQILKKLEKKLDLPEATLPSANGGL